MTAQQELIKLLFLDAKRFNMDAEEYITRYVGSMSKYDWETPALEERIAYIKKNRE